jgi:integrin-linked kinase
MMRQNLDIRIPFNSNQQQRARSGEQVTNVVIPVTNSNLIDINEILTKDHGNLESNPTHQTFIGSWQSMDVIIKIFRKSNVINRNAGNQMFNQSQARVINSFQQEYKKLRIFNCNNILPVMGISIDWPDFLLISQYIPNGTLYNILHKNQVSLVMKQKVQIALDIAKGMAFLHQLDPSTSPFINLNSKHVVLDQDFQAKINLSNYIFETLNPLNRYKIFSPNWQSPESLIKPLNELNKSAANMWSFAICLYELYTSKIPFDEFTPMRCGLAIVRDNLRIQLPNDMSPHWQKLIRICMNEEPSKRPKFEAIIPILEKLIKS